MVIHSSFCVQNLIFPTCRTNFAEVTRTKQKAERVCCREFDTRYAHVTDSCEHLVDL